jgi:hypothetical protein
MLKIIAGKGLPGAACHETVTQPTPIHTPKLTRLLYFYKTGDPMNVSEAIRTRRAVREFQDQALPEEVVLAILNAGRRSQSSKNSQAWQFIAVRDQATLQALSTCGEWVGHIARAALAVAILTPDPAEKFQRLFNAGQA